MEKERERLREIERETEGERERVEGGLGSEAEENRVDLSAEEEEEEAAAAAASLGGEEEEPEESLTDTCITDTRPGKKSARFPHRALPA